MVEGDWSDLDAGASRPFFGAAGEYAVMSELLCRGATVAVPEPDTGDNILAVRRDTPGIIRLRVKSANAEEQRSGYLARFVVPSAQLEAVTGLPVVYAFATRRQLRWSDFVVVRSDALAKLVEEGMGLPTTTSGRAAVALRVRFRKGVTECSGRDRWFDLEPFRNVWSIWPATPPK